MLFIFLYIPTFAEATKTLYGYRQKAWGCSYMAKIAATNQIGPFECHRQSFRPTTSFAFLLQTLSRGSLALGYVR